MSNYPEAMTARDFAQIDSAATTPALADAKSRLCAALDTFYAEHHADLDLLISAENSDAASLTEVGADLPGYDWEQVLDMAKTASESAPAYTAAAPSPAYAQAAE